MGRVVLQYKNLSSVLFKDVYRGLWDNFCLITTNFIMDKTCTGLLYKAGHSAAVDFGERISKQT